MGQLWKTSQLNPADDEENTTICQECNFFQAATYIFCNSLVFIAIHSLVLSLQIYPPGRVIVGFVSDSYFAQFGLPLMTLPVPGAPGNHSVVDLSNYLIACGGQHGRNLNSSMTMQVDYQYLTAGVSC